MRNRVLSILLTAVVGIALGACGPGSGRGSTPIVIGSTLPLTGVYAELGRIHQVAGQLFIDRLNAAGGLLGRKVVWDLKDDGSDAGQVAGLYQQLIDNDHVDMLMGPYGTPSILAAMPVAQRFGYVLPQHSSILAPQLTDSCQFPGWSVGTQPNQFIPSQLFDAVATLPHPPQRIAVVTSQSDSARLVTNGLGADQTGMVTVAQRRGLTVVVNADYSSATAASIAARVAAAQPDLVIDDSLGTDTADLLLAMAAIGYTPPLTFGLFPAPGGLLGIGSAAENVLSVSIFEPTPAMVAAAAPGAREIIDAYRLRAAGTNAYHDFGTQAAASWNAWEILTDGVTEAGSLDNTRICAALHSQGADTTFSGHLTFNPATNNFWDTTEVITQVQNGVWQVVWPTGKASAPLLAGLA